MQHSSRTKLFLLFWFVNAALAQSDVANHLRQANDYLKAKNPEAAAREFEAVTALDPKNAEANANLGVMAFFRRDYPKAAQYLRVAVAANPALAKTEALLGICERRLGLPSAQARLERSFPKLKERGLQIQTGLELANLYYQQGAADRAASVMLPLVDIDPDNVEILYMAQRVYSDLADNTLNKLAILAPGSARMQQVIAERLVNDGDLKGAAEHYRKALAIDSHLPGVHYELAEALLETAPTDEQAQEAAEKELKAARELEGDTSRAECLEARILFHRSDINGSYEHYKHALELNPGDAEAQVGIGRLLATMQKPQEAVRYLRMAIEADPLNEQAHYRLATVYKKLGQHEESVKELKLFQEIKQTKEQIRELYRQMNRKRREPTEPDGES